MKKLIKVAALVLGLASGFSARASIPTVDGGAIAQAVAIVKQMQELYTTTMGGWNKNHNDNEDMQKTSEEIRGELDSIHKGLSGNRTEVANLAKEKPQEVVQDDIFDSLTKADKDGNYKYAGSDTVLAKHGLSEACKKTVGSDMTTKIGLAQAGIGILAEDKTQVALGVVNTIAGMGKTSRAEVRCNNNTTRLAASQAMLNKIHENIAERKKQIQKLSDRISQTKDQKESADLTAAIAKANLEIDFETNKMTVIREAMENQQRLDNQASAIGKK